jgi:hypothetical protein
MHRTLTTPSGVKIRTATRRRFVLVREHTYRPPQGEQEAMATVVKRSDQTATLEGERRREIAHQDHLRATQGPQRATTTTFMIFDTTTGRIVCDAAPGRA